MSRGTHLIIKKVTIYHKNALMFLIFYDNAERKIQIMFVDLELRQNQDKIICAT